MQHAMSELGPDVNDETSGSGVIAVLGKAWRHKMLLALGLGVGLIIGAIYSSQLTPEYQSSLKLLVVKKRPEGLPGMEIRSAVVEDYLATHQVVIRSPAVIEGAVKKGNLQSLASFEKTGDTIGEIIRSMGVTREVTEGGSTSILNIAYRSSVAEDCPTVLNAVMESYKVFLGKTYEDVSEETLILITKAKEILEKKLTKTENDYAEFRLIHPVPVRGKDGMSVRQEKRFNIESKRDALVVRQFEIQERLTAFQNGLKSGQDPSRLLAIAESNIKPKNEQEDAVTTLQREEQSLLEFFGPDHPQLRDIRKRIETVRGNMTTKQEALPIDPVQAHVRQLKRELAEVETSEKALSKLLEMEQDTAKNLVADEIKDENYRKEIARQQQLFEGTLKRLQEIGLLTNLGGFRANVINPAGPAGKVGPRLLPIITVAGLLGLFAGIGLAYLAEITDRSFRSSEDIRRRLGLQIVGQIPMLPTMGQENTSTGNGGPTLAPILCAFHEPKSRNAEAYRGVRTGLFFSTQGKGHKVIQVTSPSAGDGKSTLAANLAISIAQAKKRVILLDADFRRPTIHKLFGLSAARGLASVLLEEAELADVIQPSGIAELSILPCGPIPANPAELLSLPRFKELLDHIREQFDFVIIDTPPMLAVTDPCMVVPLADGVLLTLRLSKHTQAMAVRAKEVLATLNATIIGVVVNAIDERKAGYGYGGYEYGYGYSYGYGAGAKYYQHAEPIEGGMPEKATLEN